MINTKEREVHKMIDMHLVKGFIMEGEESRFIPADYCETTDTIFYTFPLLSKKVKYIVLQDGNAEEMKVIYQEFVDFDLDELWNAYYLGRVFVYKDHKGEKKELDFRYEK